MAEAVAGAILAGATTEAAVGAAVWIGANAAVINTVLLAAVNIGLQSQQQRKAEARARAAANASLTDRQVMIRSAVAPRRVVYGTDHISGPIVFAQSTGTLGEYLHLVIALADGECESIEEVWFNDVKLPAPDGSGYITTGEFSNSTVSPRGESRTASGGGVVTLSEAASQVTAISVEQTNYWLDDRPQDVAVVGWAHTPPSATITGLTPGTTYWVNYQAVVTGSHRVRIKKHLGQAGQVADADLVAESGGKWTSAHVGVGICYLYVRLQYDNDVWGQIGIPNISCVVKGRKVRDPRSGLTVWSNNAALIAASWLRDNRFGIGATAGQVPDADVIAAANVCDELVTLDGLGTTQKRYIFDGGFTAQEAPRDVLADILQMMAGSAVWVQGRWLVRAGAYRTPALTITADTLAGSGVNIVPKASRSELYNAVRATHRDAGQHHTEVQAPLVANAGYQTADGGRQLVRAITLPGVADTWRAQRLAKIDLERSRQAVTVQLTTNLAAYDLAPTDTVALTLDRYGWSAKAFEVVERTWNPLGTLAYTLRETAPGVWAWNYGEATVGDLAPDTTLPSPYAKPATLIGLAAASGSTHLQYTLDGSIVTRCLVTWTQSTDAFVVAGGRIEIEWKRASATAWQASSPVAGADTSSYLAPMPDATLILVRARAVNAAGRASDWATIQHSLTGTGLAGRGDVYRVASRGSSASGYPVEAGLYHGETGALLYSSPSVYRLIKIHRATGATYSVNYYSLPADAATLAADLNAIGNDHIVVVFTRGDAQVGRLTSGVDAAMYRCGASRAIFGSPQFKAGAAYILVGIAGCGEGQGFEAYQGATDSDTNAWCDVAFSVLAGNLNITGSSATPRTLADYSYTGDLGATRDVTLLASSGIALAGNTATKTGATNAWDEQVYSSEAYAGGAYASAVVGSAQPMFGLNSDPTTDASYTSIDYAIYADGSGIWRYQSGTGTLLHATPASVGDTLAVVYDGYRVHYMHNGVERGVVVAGVGLKLHFDSSLYSAGHSLRSIRFGPLSSVAGIDTAQILGGAVAEVVSVEVASDTWAIPDNSSSSVQRILGAGSIANYSGRTVSVEVTFTAFRVLTAGSGAGSTSLYHFMRSYIDAVFNDNFPPATNNPEDIVGLTSGQVRKWAQSYTRTYSLASGSVLTIESVANAATPTMSGSTLETQGLALRLTSIKA